MSIEINVKDVLLSRFGSTDNEFIKGLKQDVVYYARGNSFDIRGLDEKSGKFSGDYLSERIKKIEDYIRNKTNWNLVSGYIDISGTSVRHYVDDMNSCELLSGRIALDKLLHDSHCFPNFNIIVIDDASQLTRLVSYLHELVEEFALNDVFVFCLDEESFITFTDDDPKPNFSESFDTSLYTCYEFEEK